MTEPSVPAVPEGVRELDIIGVRTGAFGASGSGDTSGFGGLVEPIVLPAPAIRPFGGWYDEISDEIELSLADRGPHRRPSRRS
jgi:NADH-quinone oxidoreductase subunit C